VTSRRVFLASLSALALTRGSRAEDALGPPVRDLIVRDLTVERERFTLFVPTHLAPNEHVPLLVLLHGLAETKDVRMGAYAWLERYGLGTAYDRLRRPPLERTSRRQDWTSARLDEVNAALVARPFRGMAIACPYTPNVYTKANPSAALDAFATWIVDHMIPRCHIEAPVVPDAQRTALDGCSLGGYVGLEVFLRRPEAFAAWGGVQSAISEAGATSYAERIKQTLARVGPRKIHLETSTLDPYRGANEKLAAELSRRRVPIELCVVPGPHDQPWLREAGTIEMLLWHDRALRESS